MKTLSTLLVASTLLLSATVANASYSDVSTTKTLTTGVSDSRDAAYQAGVNKLSTLKSANSYQLSDEIGLFGSGIDEDTVELSSNSFVTVEERMNSNGQVGYVGIVNVGVSYETHEDDE